MSYTARFSNDLSETKINGIFCQAKFGQRVVCPRCDSRSITKTDREHWRCRKCWSFFGLRTGTFLAKKRIPLRLWYEIAYGFATNQPAHRLQKILKAEDYRTIYGGYKAIRQALVQNSRKEFEELRFTDTTEVDESYYGGKFKNLRKEVRWKLRRLGLAKRGRGAKFRKQPVFGIYQRDGKVYLELIPDAQNQSWKRSSVEWLKRAARCSPMTTSDTTGWSG